MADRIILGPLADHGDEPETVENGGRVEFADFLGFFGLFVVTGGLYGLYWYWRAVATAYHHHGGVRVAYSQVSQLVGAVALFFGAPFVLFVILMLAAT